MLKLNVKVDMGDVMERLAQAKENTMSHIGAEVALNFYQVVATYDHEVTFREEKHEDYHAIGTDDEIFVKNNDGFERFVILSEDFQRKTVPGQLVSFPGQGRVVAFTPFGIKVPAGRWDEANAEDVASAAGPIAKQEYSKLFPGG